MTVPAVLIGAVGASTDWSKTELYAHLITNSTNGTQTVPRPDGLLILPLVLRYLTPNYIAFFGLGAISAAVMSSTDSSILSASSMFVHNIYKTLFRPRASSRELLWAIRAAIIVVGTLATLMGLTVNSVYSLFALCSDLVYVILFPQLVCVIYIKFSNTYGSVTGYLVGLILRVIGGEKLIGLPALVKYPFYTEKYGQMFPFRSLAMVCSLITIMTVSYLMQFLFLNGHVSMKKDFLRCFREKNEKDANGHVVTTKSCDDAPLYHSGRDEVEMVDKKGIANGRENTLL